MSELFLKHMVLPEADASEFLIEERAAADGAEPEMHLRAHFSTAGVMDSYGDIVNKKAIEEMEGIELAMVWSHQRGTIIGKGQIERKGNKAIWDGTLFNTDAGRDAYETIKAMGSLMEYSWGFMVKDARPIDENGKPLKEAPDYWWGPVEILSVDAHEVSPVLKGANPQTGTLSIRSEGMEQITPEQAANLGVRCVKTSLLAIPLDAADGDTQDDSPAPAPAKEPEQPQPGLRAIEEGDAALAAVSAYVARMESLAETRAAEGRTFSQEHLDRLKAIRAQVDDLIAADAAHRGVPIGNKFRDLDLLKMKRH